MTSDGKRRSASYPRAVDPLLAPLKVASRPVRRRVRWVTRHRRMLPSFLILGAQRAGTTSLFYYLRAHPEILGPRPADSSVYWPKETHFFDERFHEGIDWYRAFFPLEATRRLARMARRDLIAGEATPYYLFHPLAPVRAAKTIPDAKLIAILRDPIERAYSHYQMMCHSGRETLSFDEAVAAESERLGGAEQALFSEQGELLPSGHRKHHHHRHRAYIGRSLYAEQLERWLAHFPGSQVLVLESEELLEAPPPTYSRVLRFLGVREWQPRSFPVHNKKPYAPLDRDVRLRLEELFAGPNARLAELLGWSPSWMRASGAAPSATPVHAHDTDEGDGRSTTRHRG